ncbi:cytochrome P450 CYP72A219-like [Chenopodium quinoa]|uniref:cytochrome P450 CYP72A219-like n=1 Tax=Chenopodium quinoa TaxID=63459 RepID=UPI000B78986A|nr:cytochrome P450 CYP72A219-like [Chenopodium quinoa]
MIYYQIYAIKNSKKYMETMTASSVFLSIVSILVVTLLIKVLNWVWLRPKKLERLLRQQGFSGTSYKFLFGDLQNFVAKHNEALKTPMDSFSDDYFPRVEPFRHQLASKFGKDFFLWFGPVPIIQISKPQLIREALTKTQDIRKLKVNPIIGKLFPGVIGHEGEKWAKHRKLINPAFHLERLKLMLPVFRDSCEEILSKWEMLVAERGSGELDVFPDLMQLSADVISRAAFGSSYEEGQKIFELLKEQTDLGLLMQQSVYFPGKRFIPTTENRRFKMIEDHIQSSLREIINKRKEEIDAGKAVKADLLGILMDSNSKEVQTVGSNKKRRVGMTLAEVADECKLFYLAGQETTSILIVWTLIMLSKHQDWQKRAREEVLQTHGSNVPDFEGLNHLKTMTMILYEVLRLYPPVMQLFRRIHKDTNLGSLSIPSGVELTFFLSTIHRDKEIWGDDAEEFKPDRFAEGISKATKGNNSFFPFGWGPRICVGGKFAITEAKMALCMILQRFSFELSPSYIHAPRTRIFLGPQHGACIILNKL